MSKQIKPEDFAKRIVADAMKFRVAAGSALYIEATKIMAKSVPITPFDKGFLRGSAFVTLPEPEVNKILVELGYGGFASTYALKVHEAIDSATNWKEPGTGSKYLEKPFDAAQSGMSRRLSKQAMASLLSGIIMNPPGFPKRPK
jgi:hypothetical protein